MKKLFFIVFLAGLLIPFIPSLFVIEVFYLLIPFGIAFVGTLVYLVVSFYDKNVNRRKAIFTFSMLPVFIFSQLAAGFLVDKVQRIRCNTIIKKIQEIKTETGSFPDKYETSMGIEYMKTNNSFQINYSRGFLITEKYDSESRTWKSYGWND